MHFLQEELHDGLTVDGGQMPPDLHDTHHLWLKAILLAVWVVFSFGMCFFARDLQGWVEGLQLAYWMVAQGAILMFMAIALVYCVGMDIFERRAATTSPQTPTAPTPPYAQPRRH